MLNRRNLIIRAGTIAAVGTGISGCITMPVNALDDAVLSANHGFLVMELGANVSLGHLSAINYTGSIGAKEVMNENLVGPEFIVTVREPYKFWVIAVPVGEYSWSRFTIGVKFGAMRQVSHFRIAPAILNYVGSIDLSINSESFLLRVRDGEDNARRQVSERYPKLAKRYPFNKQLTIIKS